MMSTVIATELLYPLGFYIHTVDMVLEGGFFGSLGGGITYDIDPATQLHLGAAFVRSRTGGFQTKSIDFGVQYNFSLFSE